MKTMYNRYIPQSDGTYRKNPMPDSSKGCCREEPSPPRQPEPCGCSNGLGIGQFLHSLLPRGLDVGDLMVILLLLIISGDSREDPNTALLTLVLYLFL